MSVMWSIDVFTKKTELLQDLLAAVYMLAVIPLWHELRAVGRGGAVVRSVPSDRMVAGSNPTVAAA